MHRFYSSGRTLVRTIYEAVRTWVKIKRLDITTDRTTRRYAFDFNPLTGGNFGAARKPLTES